MFGSIHQWFQEDVYAITQDLGWTIYHQEETECCVLYFPTTETDELSTESKDELIFITDGTANHNTHEAMNMSLRLCLHLLLLPAILYGFSII